MCLCKDLNGNGASLEWAWIQVRRRVSKCHRVGAVSECMGLCTMHKWGASTGWQFEWDVSAGVHRGVTSVVLL